MCVFFIVKDIRPTDIMVEDAYETNDAGAGIAWREQNDKGEPIVHWKKGLDLKTVKELCKSLPKPYVVHFRIPSIGGKKEELCHPFPITNGAELFLNGVTKGWVLFHNGHWRDWEKHSLELCTHNPDTVTVPDGDWTDTRAMAWIASYTGVNSLKFTGEKLVALGPNEGDMSIMVGSGFTKVDGIWCSNGYFKGGKFKNSNSYHIGGRVCSMSGCLRRDIVGQSGRCPLHPLNFDKDDNTEPWKSSAERSAQTLLPGDKLPGNNEDTAKILTGHLGSPGGATSESPFRDVEHSEGEGKDNGQPVQQADQASNSGVNQESQEGPKLLGEGTGSHEKVGEPELGSDPSLMGMTEEELWIWAAGQNNPKWRKDEQPPRGDLPGRLHGKPRVRGSDYIEDDERALRLAMRREGKVFIGPM